MKTMKFIKNFKDFFKPKPKHKGNQAANKPKQVPRSLYKSPISFRKPLFKVEMKSKIYTEEQIHKELIELNSGKHPVLQNTKIKHSNGRKWEHLKYGYYVSNDALVWCKDSNIIMTPSPNSRGYLIFQVCFGGKIRTVRLHRAVAYCFCDPPAEASLFNDNSKWKVHHINGNKLDNRAKNLIWLTHKEHCKIHAAQRKGIDVSTKKKIKEYLAKNA